MVAAYSGRHVFIELAGGWESAGDQVVDKIVENHINKQLNI